MAHIVSFSIVNIHKNTINQKNVVIFKKKLLKTLFEGDECVDMSQVGAFIYTPF